MKSNKPWLGGKEHEYNINMITYVLLFATGLFFIKTSIMFSLLGLIVFIQSYKRKTLKFSAENLMLLSTLVVYVAIDFFNNRANVEYSHYDVYINVFLVFNTSFGYFFGYHMLKNSARKAESIFWKMIVIMAVSTGLFAFIGLLYKIDPNPSFVDYLKQIEEYYDGRWGYNVWLNESVYPTNFNNQFSFAIAMIFSILFYIKNKISKYLLMVILAASIWSSFATSTRTNIYLIVFSTGIGFVLDLIFNQNKSAKRLYDFIKTYKIAATVVIMLFFTSTLLLWKRIISFLQQTSLYSRFDNIEKESMLNGRIDLQLDVLRNIPKYPLGNMDLFWAHNIWIDVARTSGFIPMTMLMIYTIMTLMSLIALLRNNYVDIKIRLTSASLFLGLYLAFSIEPVLNARPHLLAMFCLFNGMVYYLSKMSPE